jgi:hypothetical protein
MHKGIQNIAHGLGQKVLSKKRVFVDKQNKVFGHKHNIQSFNIPSSLSPHPQKKVVCLGF